MGCCGLTGPSTGGHIAPFPAYVAGKFRVAWRSEVVAYVSDMFALGFRGQKV